MTCEFLPPTLTTRRARAAERISSATAVLRMGTGESEIALPDGTTITAKSFPEWVAYAKDWSGHVGTERQAMFDGILAIDAERKLAASTPRRGEAQLAPIYALLLAIAAAMILAVLIYAVVMGFAWLVEATTTATLAQATQAQFIEYSPEAHQ